MRRMHPYPLRSGLPVKRLQQQPSGARAVRQRKPSRSVALGDGSGRRLPQYAGALRERRPKIRQRRRKARVRRGFRVRPRRGCHWPRRGSRWRRANDLRHALRRRSPLPVGKQVPLEPAPSVLGRRIRQRIPLRPTGIASNTGQAEQVDRRIFRGRHGRSIEQDGRRDACLSFCPNTRQADCHFP